MIFCLGDLAGQGESLAVGKTVTCGDALIRLLKVAARGDAAFMRFDSTAYLHQGDRERADHAA